MNKLNNTELLSINHAYFNIVTTLGHIVIERAKNNGKSKDEINEMELLLADIEKWRHSNPISIKP